MTTRLVQKHLLKGTREFEIIDDEIRLLIKTPFKKETQSVPLKQLNPEAVIGKSHLDFVSNETGETLVSLELARPSADAFNAFVSTLKSMVQQSTAMEDQPATELNGNSNEEPPEFKEPDQQARINKISQKVNADRVDEAIRMLETYVNTDETRPLITTMEALREDPHNESLLTQVADEFGKLGLVQGAILTYAPYLSIILSDDPFDNE